MLSRATPFPKRLSGHLSISGFSARRWISHSHNLCQQQTEQLRMKKQRALPAAYYRGGTSRAVFFRQEDLPRDVKSWDPIFLDVIGGPDPYGRQLDGLGGGISSLSKICIVGKSQHPEADVDYTFVSLGVKEPDVDYSSNCGNMISAAGPFAVDSKLVQVSSDASDASVRIHNTNTGKVIRATFPVVDGEAASSVFQTDNINNMLSLVKE